MEGGGRKDGPQLLPNKRERNITTNGSISRFHTEGVAMSTALSIGSVCKPTPESKPDSQTRLLTWSKSLRER